jgi:hypothetical protein
MTRTVTFRLDRVPSIVENEVDFDAAGKSPVDEACESFVIGVYEALGTEGEKRDCAAYPATALFRALPLRRAG